MKTLLVTLSLAVAGASTASAQLYRPSVVRDTTVVGAVAGALIGGHNNDRWAEGAIIGAASGALVGAVIDQSRSAPPVQYRSAGIAPVAVVPNAPVIGEPAPTVVYVSPPAPQVVYVDPYPATVVVSRPVIHYSGYWGRSHYGWNHRHRHVPHWRSHGWHARNHHHYAPPRHFGRDHRHGHAWRGHDRRGTDRHDRHDGRHHRR